MRIWLAIDPETRRVAAYEREPGDGDFPPGPRGVGWEIREIDVPVGEWRRMVRGELKAEESNGLHRGWWSKAAPRGAPPWPA